MEADVSDLAVENAERTIRASLQIIEALRHSKNKALEEVCVRIGIATGPVVVGNVIGCRLGRGSDTYVSL